MEDLKLQTHEFDALLPQEIALKVESIGVAKARMSFIKTLSLAILAGAFIGFGSMFSTIVSIGTEIPWGLSRLITGICFSLGLILVIVAGAELFTGNNLISMAWASAKVKTIDVIRNWLIVYCGNFVGAIGLAVLMFFSRQYTSANGAVGLKILTMAENKCNLDFMQAIVLGILCNVLVCLAVWLCFSAHTNTDKILSIIFPISAFVAAGFEHSVANMYVIPKALLIKTFADSNFWNSIGKTPNDFPSISWTNFFINNLLPVSLGNVIGGAVLVGLVYWFVYLRKQ
ncbi:MAG: formate transporter FocA [Saprospiraceae bacterium]